MKIVISLGGSLLTKELSSQNFKKYISAINQLSKNHKLIVVIGGGKVCRDYQKIAKELGAKNDEQDFIGIMTTHLNAATFSFGLDNGYLVKWKKLQDATEEVKKYFGKKIVVCGGYDIGTSSDYDAACFAKLVNADLLINVSNVGGVYSRDPKLDVDAKRFERLTYDEFLKIIGKNPQSPGEYRLFDLNAAKLIRKYKIKTILIDGNNPDEIIRAVAGQHNGTVVG
ncbi:MAG: UMP kinase [Candidatus Aenigmarchaeota archaeon]|nr:UMP kinase [Candidatus Aenigmarchaeota archaeon]